VGGIISLRLDDLFFSFLSLDGRTSKSWADSHTLMTCFGRFLTETLDFSFDALALLLFIPGPTPLLIDADDHMYKLSIVIVLARHLLFLTFALLS